MKSKAQESASNCENAFRDWRKFGATKAFAGGALIEIAERNQV
jgi:hypothetical protein